MSNLSNNIHLIKKTVPDIKDELDKIKDVDELENYIFKEFIYLRDNQIIDLIKYINKKEIAQFCIDTLNYLEEPTILEIKKLL